MRMALVLVDFNSITPDGYVSAYEPTGEHHVGERVEAFDPDGNQCVAEVRHVDCGRLRLALMPDTWVEAE